MWHLVFHALAVFTPMLPRKERGLSLAVFSNGRVKASLPPVAAIFRTRRPCPIGLDLQEPVVFGDPLAAAGRAGLDLAAAHGHGEVGQEGVLGLAGAVRDHVAPAGLLAHLNRFDRLGDRADLVELDEHGVGGLLLDAAGDEFRVGHEQVVADDLDLSPKAAVWARNPSQSFSARPSSMETMGYFSTQDL